MNTLYISIVQRLSKEGDILKMHIDEEERKEDGETSSSAEEDENEIQEKGDEVHGVPEKLCFFINTVYSNLLTIF